MIGLLILVFGLANAVMWWRLARRARRSVLQIDKVLQQVEEARSTLTDEARRRDVVTEVK